MTLCQLSLNQCSCFTFLVRKFVCLYRGSNLGWTIQNLPLNRVLDLSAIKSPLNLLDTYLLLMDFLQNQAKPQTFVTYLKNRLIAQDLRRLMIKSLQVAALGRAYKFIYERALL